MRFGAHPHSPIRFRRDSVTCSSTKGGSMFGLARERMPDETLTTEDTEFPHKETTEALLGSAIGV